MLLCRYLPRWMTSIIDAKSCSQCQHTLHKKNIVAIGIRTIDDSDKFAFYVEHTCSDCGKRVITSFGKEQQGTPEDLCYMLIEHFQNQRQKTKTKTNRVPVKSNVAMSNKEVDALLKFLYSSDSYEDFLEFIGAKQAGKIDED